MSQKSKGQVLGESSDEDSALVFSQKLLPPCAERSVFLNQEINRETFNQLFESICQIRDKSDAPIYLYLDSLGGSVLYAERLHELLKAPRHDGSICPLGLVGSVVPGDAEGKQLSDLARLVLDNAILAEELLDAMPSEGIGRLLASCGMFYLNDQSWEEFRKLSSEEEQGSFLFDKVGREVGANWAFTMNLCQTLHENENLFSSIDAYHLGLVDEIYGLTELYPSYRSISLEEDRK